jgi:hypothetical protein
VSTSLDSTIVFNGCIVIDNSMVADTRMYLNDRTSEHQDSRANFCVAIDTGMWVDYRGPREVQLFRNTHADSIFADSNERRQGICIANSVDDADYGDVANPTANSFFGVIKDRYDLLAT